VAPARAWAFSAPRAPRAPGVPGLATTPYRALRASPGILLQRCPWAGRTHFGTTEELVDDSEQDQRAERGESPCPTLQSRSEQRFKCTVLVLSDPGVISQALMTKAFVLTLVVALGCLGCESVREEGSLQHNRALTADSPLHTLPPASEAKGRHKSPGKKGPQRKRPVNLNRCLDSCAAGGPVLIAFCNDIQEAEVRRSCFALDKESEQKCRGFCANYFSR
jgi:hypothetical protein